VKRQGKKGRKTFPRNSKMSQKQQKREKVSVGGKMRCLATSFTYTYSYTYTYTSTFYLHLYLSVISVLFSFSLWHLLQGLKIYIQASLGPIRNGDQAKQKGRADGSIKYNIKPRSQSKTIITIKLLN
tara:strand:- start:194 stop:574 length:381 start_codon:yes stop_codon:yes gene_type:complete